MYGYALVLKQVLASTREATGKYGFWMHPSGNGCLGRLSKLLHDV
jgi:hypothetical protein